MEKNACKRGGWGQLGAGETGIAKIARESARHTSGGINKEGGEKGSLILEEA